MDEGPRDRRSAGAEPRLSRRRTRRLQRFDRKVERRLEQSKQRMTYLHAHRAHGAGSETRVVVQRWVLAIATSLVSVLLAVAGAPGAATLVGMFALAFCAAAVVHTREARRQRARLQHDRETAASAIAQATDDAERERAQRFGLPVRRR